MERMIIYINVERFFSSLYLLLPRRFIVFFFIPSSMDHLSVVQGIIDT